MPNKMNEDRPTLIFAVIAAVIIALVLWLICTAIGNYSDFTTILGG